MADTKNKDSMELNEQRRKLNKAKGKKSKSIKIVPGFKGLIKQRKKLIESPSS